MAINWADQGKYVGNPNHGGGMMSGGTFGPMLPEQGPVGPGLVGGISNTTPWGGIQPAGGTTEPVWADDFDWNTATLDDARRKLSTDKYGMVNYGYYSDEDAQRLLDGERSSMASTQQPAPGFNMSPAVQPDPWASAQSPESEMVNYGGTGVNSITYSPYTGTPGTGSASNDAMAGKISSIASNMFGGGMPLGQPPTDAPTLSTPIWGAPSYYRPGQDNQNQYNNLSASSQPWWWDQSNGSRPGTAPTAPIGGGTGGNTGGGDGGSDSFPGEGGSSGDGYFPSYADYGDYYGGYGRDIAAGIGGLFGLPLEHLADYAMGYSPSTGSFYDTYQGPGSEFIDSYDIDPSTEQGQMLLEQEFLTEVPEEESIFGNLFGADEPQYIVDPDTFLFQNKDAEEAWHSAVSDQDMAEADAIDAAGWGSDEHFDAIDKAFSDLPEAPTAPITEEYVVPDNNGTIEDISDAYTGGGFTDDAGNTYTEEAWDSYAEDVFSEMDDFEDSSSSDDSNSSDDGGYGDDSDDGGAGWGSEDAGGWGDWGDDDDGGME